MVETRCIVVPEGDSKQTWSMGTSGIFNSSVTFNSSQKIRHRLNMTVKIMNRIAKEGLTLEIWKGEGDCADLNLVGTVNEKDLGNSRPKEVEKYQSQRHNTEAPVDENGSTTSKSQCQTSSSQ